jgi:serine/threonine-protein kinase
MVGLQRELTAEGSAGKYRIVLPLGQGGTADVYLAIGDGPGGFRKLAVLKVLRKSLSSDAEFRAMFLDEARLAARLHHPNIVQTYEVLAEAGGPVIVMEYLDGQPLSELIVRGREGGGFPLAMQLAVLIDALGGLHAAHELQDFDGTPLGVVHRDISPHNLFVTVEGQSKVLDFGIAKLSRSLVETEVGTTKGKLRYMAPEQIAGDKLDRRADVYAAGVMLWEALSGERMWKGLAESEIRRRVRCGDLPRPRVAGAAVPEGLLASCARALALAPAGRYPTALALAEELERALARLPGGAPSRREIGAAVARLFADERTNTRALIEAQIARMDGAAARATGELPSVEGRGRLEDEPEARPAALATPAPRGIGAAVLVAIIMIALVAVAGWRISLGRARQAAPAVTGTEAPSGPAPGAPAGAERRASGAPAREAEAAAAAPIEAPEEKPRAAKPMARRASREPGALPAAVEAAPPARSAPDCAHPFFIDDNGIKKLRPECM